MTVTVSHALALEPTPGGAAAIFADPVASVTDNGMYEPRFGLNRKPFQTVLTNADFFESAGYQQLADTVLHALRSDMGVAVLTGPSGIGKTVTLDRFRRELDRDGQAMVLRGGNIQSTDDLLLALHRRLIPPPGKNEPQKSASSNIQRWEVLERMQRVADFWGPTIVLLDDAHLANQDVFAELRTLLEEESDGHKLVRLLIAGPLTFEEVLAEPSMSDFVQRIRAHEFLQPLTSTESVAYLKHQMQRVGGDISTIFEPKSIERIVAAADGVPRCIDLLADESLMAADRAELSVVDRASVDNALSRLRHLPHSWNVSLIESDDEHEHEDALSTQDLSETPPTAITPQAATHSVAANAIEIGGATSDSINPKRESQTKLTSPSPGVIEIGGPAVAEAVERALPAAQPATVVASANNASNSIEIGGEETSQNVSPIADTATSTFSMDVTHVKTADSAQVDETAEDLGEEVSLDEFQSDDGEGDQLTPTNSPPARPTDFDRVFGAVTVAGGAVAISKTVLSEGSVKNTSSVGAPQNVPTNSVNLERHMILATGSNADSDSAPEIQSTALAEAELPNPNDDGESANEREPTTLSGFSPWQPAGEWHSAPASPRSYFHSPGHANIKPVFDRYTWCELGRTVTAATAKRSSTFSVTAEDVTWPPVTDYVAPSNEIPVLPIDEDYSGLLADLGTLIDSTHSETNETPTAGEAASVPTDNAETQSPIQLHEPVEGFVSPEESIDNIEHLLNCENRLPNTPEADGGLYGVDGQSEHEKTSDEVTSAEVDIDESAASDTELAETDDSIHDQSDSERPPSSQQLFTLPIDIQDVEFDPSMNMRAEQTGDLDPGARMSTADEQQGELASTEQPAYEVELSEKVEISTEIQDEDIQAYAPRLLQDARARIASVSVSVGGLKLAAGAESLADDTAEAQTASYAEIHSPGSEHDSAAEPTRSFSNLFTRLRRLRGR